MAEKRHPVIHLTDGTKITLKFPKQAGDDPVTIMKNVKREKERRVADGTG